VKLRLQHDKCTGHAQCHAVDAVAFPIDDDGYSVVTERPVAADEEQAVRDGVAACPELALLLEE
jgi:ferredoxin